MMQLSVRRKAYAGRTVLEGIELHLRGGEIVALLGPSGCGKTTLLRIIGGLDRDYDGAVVWSGGSAPRIGTVFQEPRLLPWRTVRQNLSLVLPPGSGTVAEDLLRRLGLSDVLDVFPPKLSLGMARRAAIARAFAIRPELVLLDEPFVSLDAETARHSRDVLLDAWREHGLSAVIVTHDPAEAAALADRVLVLSPGPAHIATEIVIPEAQRRSDGSAAREIAARLGIGAA